MDPSLPPPVPPSSPAATQTVPALVGIVVHWRDEARLAELIAAWPRDDPRFQLLVVDNSASATTASLPAQPAALARFTDPPDRPAAGEPSGHGPGGQRPKPPAPGPAATQATIEPSAGRPDEPPGPPEPPATGPAANRADAPALGAPVPIRLLQPGRNLGFAGGVNAGMAASRAPLLLLLNPDARPEPGALEQLLAGFAAHPEAAGLAPRLTGADGEPQFAWQLRRLPSAWGCLRQTLPWPFAGAGTGAGGLAAEPPPGSPVEQPAAAALALRREALLAVGGFDERFHPAWFEDVDLAQRLRQIGARLLYWPAARFRHALGSSVPRLGYGRFLWIYHRGLERYLAKHHGAAWVPAARVGLLAGLLLRLPLVAARRPRRAASRREAAAGLLLALAGALSGWRLPRGVALDPTGAAPASTAPVTAAPAYAPPAATAREHLDPPATPQPRSLTLTPAPLPGPSTRPRRGPDGS